jgi:hypothetical protein
VWTIIRFANSGRLAWLALILCMGLSAADSVKSGGRLKRYANSRWGFCVSYPSGWNLREGFNKAGAEFFAPDHLGAGLGIGAGALQNQPLWTLSDAPEDESNRRPMTLEENVQGHLKAFADFSKSHVDVIDNSPTVLQGVGARALTVRYQKDGLAWQDKSIMVLKGEGVYYTAFYLRVPYPCAGTTSPYFNASWRVSRFIVAGAD